MTLEAGEPTPVPLRSPLMAEHGLDNLLAMQALAARLRAQAAETSLDFFRRKFEAAAEELEQWAGLPKRPGTPRFPDKGNGPGCGH